MTPRGLAPNSAPDNPRVRASLVCPLCNGAKASGLVACWPCFRTSGLKQGDPAAEARIAARERWLAACEADWTHIHGRTGYVTD
jgi:hypothetical protein